MKVLIVAPGPVHSTYDIYKYYLDAMKANENIEVHGFDMHNHLIYHKYAVDKMFPHFEPEDRQAIYTINSTRSLLYETIVYKPDFIFVVAGTLIPHEVYRELLNIRHHNNMHFGLALYLTECPYVDTQEQFVQYADVLFVNDKISVKDFDPDGSHYVDYLPHSYSPEVHYDGSMNGHIYKPEYSSDVLFGGTAFVERVDMMASVNWEGVNLKLIGDKQSWLYGNGSGKLDDFVNDKIVINNWELANYYRGTKIALNIHRTRSGFDETDEGLNNYTDAYSIGPRLYEAAACGAFILTDYRQEAVDIFGDTIDYFDTPKEMEEKIHYWLHPDNEQERMNRAIAAKERIADCTFSNRLEKYVLPVFNEISSLRRD